MKDVKDTIEIFILIIVTGFFIGIGFFVTEKFIEAVL